MRWVTVTGEALSRAELTKAELELEINKVKTEEASLRDALLKMQALNEGLGQDKIELNKIIMQVRKIRKLLFSWSILISYIQESLCSFIQSKSIHCLHPIGEHSLCDPL